MKIYSLALLLLFQFPFVLPFPEGQPIIKANKAATANIVFKSANGGQTWQDFSKGLPGNSAEGGFFANESGLYLRAGKRDLSQQPKLHHYFLAKRDSPVSCKLIYAIPGNGGCWEIPNSIKVFRLYKILKIKTIK